MIPFARVLRYGNAAPKPKAVKKIAGNGFSIAVLTGSGDLYVRGRNSTGILGLGHTNAVTSWTHSISGVKDMWFGQSGMAIKKDNDEIWYSGDGFVVGAISGLTVNVWTSAMPTFVKLTAPIKDMAISNNTCSVLLEDNTIWSTGAGQYGQLGNGTNTNNITGSFVKATIPVSAGAPVKVFAGNTMHSFINAEGRLYYTGIVNAVSTSGTGSYNTYTASQLTTTLNLKNYHNNTTGLAIGLAVDASGNNKVVVGGSRIFGQMADGVDGSISNYRAFSLQTESLMPSGDLIKVGGGFGYYNHFICTTIDLYGCGYNTSQQSGALGINTSTNGLYYTKAIIPDGFDYSNIQIIGTNFRTYITDGNFVYSTGTYTTDGGPSSLVFVLDSPTTN